MFLPILRHFLTTRLFFTLVVRVFVFLRAPSSDSSSDLEGGLEGRLLGAADQDVNRFIRNLERHTVRLLVACLCISNSGFGCFSSISLCFIQGVDDSLFRSSLLALYLILCSSRIGSFPIMIGARASHFLSLCACDSHFVSPLIFVSRPQCA